MPVLQEKQRPLASLLSEVQGLLDSLTPGILQRQSVDGHWHYALDDNMTMNAEYILFHGWLKIENPKRIARLANAILKRQNLNGSWSLYFEGPGNLSTTVEAYFALRIAGYPAENPALKLALEFILSEGGIPKVRVFTKIWLALFGLYPWTGIPMIPPEILLAPRQIPFNIYEFSYWSRMTIVPLTILFHLQKTIEVEFDLDELYLNILDKQKTELVPPPPSDESWIIPSTKWDMGWINWEQVFIALNRGVGLYESKVPIKPLRAFCVRRARDWILRHQEESGDWGGIQPPMLNSIMALHALGMELSELPIQKGLAALEKFTRGESDSIPRFSQEDESEAVLQSCVSPIWDTALAALGCIEAGVDPKSPQLQRTKDWLWNKRIRHKGDWAIKAKLKKNQPFAAWCFQYENSQFPDVDDTCMVALTLHKLGMTSKELQPALNWLFAMQNTDGGFGTFDRDNNQVILNRIPFADLKSLIDPSNPDVTGHVLEALGELGFDQSPQVNSAIRYLKITQRSDGAWFGRWGVNLIYGTSAALVGLRKVGEPVNAPYIQRAIKYLLSKQNPDGGFGESCGSYGLSPVLSPQNSTPSQTAWGLMALQSCMQDKSYDDEIFKALEFLKTRRCDDGFFEKEFTGTGFPQHFFLRYDGYRNFFPLIALGRLKNTLSI